jgi:hypothetical protein
MKFLRRIAEAIIVFASFFLVYAKPGYVRFFLVLEVMVKTRSKTLFQHT